MTQAEIDALQVPLNWVASRLHVDKALVRQMAAEAGLDGPPYRLGAIVDLVIAHKTSQKSSDFRNTQQALLFQQTRMEKAKELIHVDDASREVDRVAAEIHKWIRNLDKHGIPPKAQAELIDSVHRIFPEVDEDGAPVKKKARKVPKKKKKGTKNV